MPTITTTVDAWLGATTVTTTMDGLVSLTSTLTTATDGYVSKPLWTTADALVTDSRGTFRGTMTAAQRDAISLVQVGDTVLVTDE